MLIKQKRHRPHNDICLYCYQSQTPCSEHLTLTNDSLDETLLCDLSLEIINFSLQMLCLVTRRHQLRGGIQSLKNPSFDHERLESIQHQSRSLGKVIRSHDHDLLRQIMLIPRVSDVREATNDDGSERDHDVECIVQSNQALLVRLAVKHGRDHRTLLGASATSFYILFCVLT